MEYARLKHWPLRRKLAIGVCAATSLLAAGWFITAASGPRPLNPVHSPTATINHETIAKAAVDAPADKPAAPVSTPAFPQLSPQQAVLLKAKFAVLSSPSLTRDEPVEAAPPPPPMVTGIGTPPAFAPPAPQPMEVATQTAEAPAQAAPTAVHPAMAGYFGRGAASIQHLPMPSH
jgi:hypothetical protein